MNLKLIAYTSDPEKVIELCGRVSHRSDKKIDNESAGPFCKKMIQLGHLSTLESASATFLISGISRAASHQIVRNRLCSIVQMSQRYVDQSDIGFVIPESIMREPNALGLFKRSIDDAKRTYEILISQYGIPREDARFLLPEATETELSITANFREYLHVIDERVSRHAQWEIREIFSRVWKFLYGIAPNVFHIDYFRGNHGKDMETKEKIFLEIGR
jgi:thymidylate synthase (FAD)